MTSGITRHPRLPFRLARWLHFLVGFAAVLLAFRATTGAGAVAMPFVAIAYVAWTARRAAGLALAVIAGTLELLVQIERMGPTNAAAALAGLWLSAYLVVALAASAVETATRPEPG